MSTTMLDTNTKIIDASVIDTHQETADADSSGYLLSNGTNRRIMAGISTAGNLVIWMHTNGDPVELGEGEESDWCADMGDTDTEPTSARIRQGAQRLCGAIEYLRGIYIANEAAADDLDWAADRARDARKAADELEASETDDE